MAIIHESQNTFWRSRLKESAFGTRLAHSADYRRILTTDKSPFTHGAATENDGDHAHGSDRPQNVWLTGRNTGKSFPTQFNFTDIGYALIAALGSVSTSGAGTDKTHAITPQSMNTSRQLPSYTMGQKIGGAWLDIFTSMVCNSLSISGSRTGRIQVSEEYVGNGAYEQDPSSYAQPSLTSGLEFGYAQQCTVNLTDGGSFDEDLECLLEEWSWSFNNNLDQDGGYRICSAEFSAGVPESGYVRNELLVGVRDYKFNGTYRLNSSTDPMRGAFDAGTILTVTHAITSTRDIPTTSTPWSLTIEHTRARIIEANIVVVNGYDAVQFTAELLSSSGSIPLTATLVNNIASYTT